ncbi:MAG: hypothetical protein RI909_1653 [Bacteroidota bacterium]|jgi:hypothetical protein
MSNRIDQLFKEKLSDHKVAPSAEAWMKVQSGLSKKNKLVIVWRMAAVFVLFGAFIGTWYFLNHDNTINTPQLTEKSEIITPENDVIEKPIKPLKESAKPNIAQTPKSERKKKEIQSHEIKKELQNSVAENSVTNNQELQKQAEEVTIAEPVLVAQAEIKEKPIVIEFTLEPITKEAPVAVAQTLEEDNSGLKKIWDAARDVKNGDSDLSIIRDAKNQLFALDFRKDKSKRN